MAATKAERRTRGTAIPERFVPQFWADADGRQGIVQEIRRRVHALRDDTAADCTQKDLLVQRAVFLSLRLETMEVEAAQTGAFDAGAYTQMTNTLIGILKALGLDRAVRKAGTLKDYIAGRGR